VDHAAALASLGHPAHLERERALNRAARDYTAAWFTRAGCPVTASATNFVMAGIGRPVEDFRRACAAEGVAVGRPFPPLDRHVRVSVGTMDEMRRAVAVFGRVLGTG
jgi:histidinol-phosphate aminotransferase